MKVGDRVRSKISNKIGIVADVDGPLIKIEFGPALTGFVRPEDFDKYYAVESS